MVFDPIMISNFNRFSLEGSWLVSCLNWTLLVLVVTVPIIPYRYLVFPFQIPLYFGFTPFIFSFFALAIWIVWRRHTLLSVLQHLPLSRPIGGILLVGVISSLGSSDPGFSLERVIYYFLTGGMLCLIISDFYSKIGCSQRILVILMVTAYLVASYGIVEFFLRQNPFLKEVFSPKNPTYLQLSPDPWFGRRILSSIGHPVFLGAYLVPFLPVSLSFLFQGKNRLTKVVFLIGSGLLMVALLLTFSRGAWVAGLIATLVFLKLRNTRNLMLFFSVFSISLLLFLSFEGVSEMFWARIGEIYEQYIIDFPSSSRGQAYGYVAEIFGRHPIFGLGTGMYRFNAYYLGRAITWPPTLDTPDNMYLIRLAEQGSLGLFALIFFFAHLFRFLYRVNKSSEGQARAFLSGYIGFCVEMLTCSILHFPTTRIVFWIFTGLALSVPNHLKIKKTFKEPY